MTNDSLSKMCDLWQQGSGEPPRFTPDELRHNMNKFERTIARRNLIEYLAAALVIGDLCLLCVDISDTHIAYWLRAYHSGHRLCGLPVAPQSFGASCSGGYGAAELCRFPACGASAPAGCSELRLVAGTCCHLYRACASSCSESFSSRCGSHRPRIGRFTQELPLQR